MKAVCIVGSARSDGNTSNIVDRIIEGMKENNIEIAKYCLGELSINYCKGCMSCSKTGKCVQADDMDFVMNDLFAADIVLIASPSYWGDVTGQLKVFFDRNTPYCDNNPSRPDIPSGKKGIAVAIRAGRNHEENAHLIQAIEHYFGHLGIKPAARLTIEGLSDAEDLESKYAELQKAFEIGRDILKLD